MRGTIHLVTAADAVAMYPLTRRLHGQSFASNFGEGLAGADPAEVTAAAVELMAAEPRTKAELAEALAERWPDADRQSLGVLRDAPRAVRRRCRRAACSGSRARFGWRRWSSGSAASWTPIRRRRRWCGATWPRSARPRWPTCARGRASPACARSSRSCGPSCGRSATGRAASCSTCPAALLPDPDTPAPPRFLPRLDNATLSHDDRSRILDGGGPDVRWRGRGPLAGHLLIDGFHRAGWVLAERQGRGHAGHRRAERPPPEDVEAEARALLDFWAPGAERRELVL